MLAACSVVRMDRSPGKFPGIDRSPCLHRVCLRFASDRPFGSGVDGDPSAGVCCRRRPRDRGAWIDRLVVRTGESVGGIHYPPGDSETASALIPGWDCSKTTRRREVQHTEHGRRVREYLHHSARELSGKTMKMVANWRDVYSTCSSHVQRTLSAALASGVWGLRAIGPHVGIPPGVP